MTTVDHVIDTLRGIARHLHNSEQRRLKRLNYLQALADDGILNRTQAAELQRLRREVTQ